VTTPPRKAAAWVAICVACTGAFEGLRTVAYRDPIGIPTYCFGETLHPSGRPVQLGDKATVDECKDLLASRVVEFGDGVDKCLTRPARPNPKAAYTSLAYNIGVPAFCKSSIARKHNAGDELGACEAILLYNKAGGMTLPGLVKRRGEERKICLTPDSAAQLGAAAVLASLRY
jgi:lysozyme